jgi:signal transduction histidine kinase
MNYSKLSKSALIARLKAEKAARRRIEARIAAGRKSKRPLDEHAQRQRLEEIDRASLAITTVLAQVSAENFAAFLQVIVDQARDVTHADYAALRIGKGEGEGFEPWVFSGVAPKQAREMGTPIRYHGSDRGTLYLANDRRRPEFMEEDRILVGMLADRIAPAVEIARLRQVEVRERARLEFLAAAGPVLSESIEYEATLKAIAGLVVPALADLSMIDLLLPSGSLVKIAICHRDPAQQTIVEQLLGEAPPEGLPEDVRTAIETMRPQRRDVTPEFLKAHVPEGTFREIVGAIGAKSGITAPLVLRNRVIGVLRLVMTTSGRRFSDADLSLAQDVAHHGALAIEDARLYQSAQNAKQARDELLAVVSHDLRNYLSTIRMSAEVLSHMLSNQDLPKTTKPLDALRRAACRMEQLIRSLRDATMIETGRLTIHPTKQDVASLLDDSMKTLSPQADARKMRLDLTIAPRLPEVSWDGERIQQVVANLVGNSIKFSNEGDEIRVVAKAVNSAIRISVVDSGVGIAEEQFARVFERQWTGDGEGRKSTGLGLFIARGIVQAHGGTIGVESKVGVGSTFSFTLPIEARTSGPQVCRAPNARPPEARPEG